ncbi:hypothetical protein [Thalassomonas actiniarum]|uniref:Uncharacterized protein n=1 Tax=Thalassomonas actiniarum TaxID=485447 RepID=A0AAE9YZC3_9GAMM|nr:hypothetical protein [Thalassomonas actiniarum]WDE02402.1 hypothetical protein SG35_028740 [Thalassomonas actiniarum]
MMKKILTIVSLLALMNAPAYSEDREIELTEAPSDFVLKALEDCKIYAVEDEVDAKRLNRYLLDCINDELELSDYRRIAKLPTQ